jgi:hypothetical protein
MQGADRLAAMEELSEWSAHEVERPKSPDCELRTVAQDRAYASPHLGCSQDLGDNRARMRETRRMLATEVRQPA